MNRRLPSRCFGVRSVGTIFGVLAIAAVVGGAVGPLLAGLIFDATGSYYPAFVVFAVGEATAAIAISQARSPRLRRRRCVPAPADSRSIHPPSE